MDNCRLYTYYSYDIYHLLYCRAFVRLVLHSNAAVNVVVYAGRLKEFREYIKQDLQNLPCWRSKDNNQNNVPMQPIIKRPKRSRTCSELDSERATTILTNMPNSPSVRNSRSCIEDMNTRNGGPPQQSAFLQSGISSNRTEALTPLSKRHFKSRVTVIETDCVEEDIDKDGKFDYDIFLYGKDLPSIQICRVPSADKENCQNQDSTNGVHLCTDGCTLHEFQNGSMDLLSTKTDTDYLLDAEVRTKRPKCKVPLIKGKHHIHTKGVNYINEDDYSIHM